MSKSSEPVVCVGMDMGFRKTGLTAIRLDPQGDELIAATTVASDPDGAKNQIHADVLSCSQIIHGIKQFIGLHKPRGIFVELPHGGSQGARAGRCMGAATGLAITLLEYENIGFELYAPADVEVAIGIHLNKKKKTELKLSKGESTKWKKERLKEVVIREWPFFAGWPVKPALAEDAYDSAAAFMCGRFNNDLYKRLRALV